MKEKAMNNPTDKPLTDKEKAALEVVHGFVMSRNVKPSIKIAEAKRIVGIFYEAMGWRPDRYGNFLHPTKNDERIHFSKIRVQKQYKFQGTWSNSKTSSPVDSATLLVVDAAKLAGHQEMVDAWTKKKAAKKQAKVKATKKREDKTARQVAGIRAMKEMAFEQPRLLALAGYGVKLDEDVFQGLMKRRDELTDKHYDNLVAGNKFPDNLVASADRPPVLPLFYEPVQYLWEEIVDGVTYSIYMKYVGRGEASVSIGSAGPMGMTVNPKTHRIEQAYYEAKGDAQISGRILFNGEMFMASLFMISSSAKQKGAGTRILSIWCRMMAGYGIEAFRGEAVGKEGAAFLKALAAKGKINIMSSRGSNVLVQCMAGILGDTPDWRPSETMPEDYYAANPVGDYVFVTACTGWHSGEDINEMKDESKQITRQTFLKWVDKSDFKEVEKSLGYDRNFPMSKDWHVGYDRSKFVGVPCVYFTWSGIEYIFVDPDKWNRRESTKSNPTKLPGGFEGFGADGFGEQEDVSDTGYWQATRKIGVDPSMLDASRLLKPPVLSKIEPKAVYSFPYEKQAWMLQVPSEAVAKKVASMGHKNLLGKRSLTSSDPYLYERTLYVAFPAGYIKVDPPTAPKKASPSKRNEKELLAYKGKQFFGEKGFAVSGSKGKYKMEVRPALKKFKGIFSTTATSAPTIGELDGRLDQVIEKLSGVKSNPVGIVRKGNPAYKLNPVSDDRCKRMFDEWAKMAKDGKLMPHSKDTFNSFMSYENYSELDAKKLVECGKKGYASVAGHSREQWLIPVDRMHELEKRIARFEKKTAKLKLKNPIRFEVMGEKIVPLKNDEGKLTGKVAVFKIVELHGEAPTVSGYTFIARVQHTEAGNILDRAPGTEKVKLPKAMWTAGPTCDHCKKIRSRNETFVLRNDKTGKLIRVGRSCLADFLRSKDVEMALSIWSIIEAIKKEQDEWTEEGEGGGSRFLDMKAFLATTWLAIETEGWTSKSKAFQDEDKVATVNTVEWAMFPLSGKARPNEVELWKKLQPKPKDIANAKKVLAWAKAIKPTSDYEMNLKTASGLDYVPPKSAGLIASMVAMYKRAKGDELYKKTQKKLAADKVNEWFGAAGSTYIRKLTVLRAHEINNDWGLTVLYVMEDDDGRSFKWFSSDGTINPRYGWDNPKRDENMEKDNREEMKLEPGDSLWFKFTIKKHDTWDNRKSGVQEKSTIITRAKVSEDKPSAKWFDPATGEVFKTKKAMVAGSGQPVAKTTSAPAFKVGDNVTVIDTPSVRGDIWRVGPNGRGVMTYQIFGDTGFYNGSQLKLTKQNPTGGKTVIRDKGRIVYVLKGSIKSWM